MPGAEDDRNVAHSAPLGAISLSDLTQARLDAGAKQRALAGSAPRVEQRQAGCTKVRDENSPFGISSEEDCCVPLRVGREAHIRTAPSDARRNRRLERTHVSASVGAEASNSALRRRTQDRKSTRLNSSHSSISYAVFC